MRTLIFDLDRTLCETDSNDYAHAKPIEYRIKAVNDLYDAGNHIKVYTARHMSRHQGDIAKVYETSYQETKAQLISWGLKHHELIMGKPSGDVIVDDIAISDKDFFKKYGKRGVIVGNFDVLHPGYIMMFQEAKKHCDFLTIALHIDPTLERKVKLPTILSTEERTNTLLSLIYVDQVIPYNTEQNLYDLLVEQNFDIRFAGSDYHEKNFTGSELPIPMHYIDRSHGWSTTKFKNKIYHDILTFRQEQGLPISAEQTLMDSIDTVLTSKIEKIIDDTVAKKLGNTSTDETIAHE